MGLDYIKERNKLISINLLLSRFRRSKNIRTFQTYKSAKSSKIVYRDGKMYGSISYEDVDKRVRFVTFKLGEKTFSRFIIKKDEYDKYTFCSDGIMPVILEFIDLETGSTIYQSEIQKDTDDKVVSQKESVTVLDEQSLVPYLCEDNFVKADYEINEFVAYCNRYIVNRLMPNNDNMTLN